ncbi:MAG: NADAR family protein [Pseudomonadota bacterium]
MITFPSAPAITEADLPKAHNFTAFHPFIKGVFSQWHATPFELDGLSFNCAEQWMMAAKASLFKDEVAFERIMQTNDPALQKRLGAGVHSFDERAWHHWRIHIVFHANSAKFAQNAGAARQLLNTTPAMLVEANPRDWNWGNGLALDDARNHDPNAWRGANLLGRTLTCVRETLIEEEN